ncbi:MAG: putative phosphoesterase or phosphohydrolase [Fibrobacteres bacterium]|nr:putative phosphoesterase or phosphohydrolase [Fibrobacterota bacterium]
MLPTARETFAGGFRRVAFFGGVYSNYLALAEAHALARSLKVDAVFALGDFGAFGPHPDRTVDFLRESGIPCIQGNYEEALSDAAEDCRCGYTDPRDNHYARLSFDYTSSRTSPHHKAWMGDLPRHLRLTLGGTRVLCCHGSPRRINEFLWASSTSDAYLRRLLDEYGTDLLVCTHTGLHWSRMIAPAQGGRPARGILNVGALGRPANNGRTEVWFAIAEASEGGVRVEFVPVPYDHGRLAREMEAEGLPREFRETILTGWWTTCLEILPAKERAAGRF